MYSQQILIHIIFFNYKNDIDFLWIHDITNVEMNRKFKGFNVLILNKFS
jgi:hypothetical protein